MENQDRFASRNTNLYTYDLYTYYNADPVMTVLRNLNYRLKPYDPEPPNSKF